MKFRYFKTTIWGALSVIMAEFIFYANAFAQGNLASDEALGEPSSTASTSQWLPANWMDAIPLVLLLIAFIFLNRRRISKGDQTNKDNVLGSGSADLNKLEQGSIKGPNEENLSEKDAQVRERLLAQAQAMWAYLGINGNSKQIRGDVAFSQSEFMQGAKPVYSRLWDAAIKEDRDLLLSFASEKVANLLIERARKYDHSALLLIDAEFAGTELLEGKRKALVDYNVTLGVKNTAAPVVLRDRWYFVREEGPQTGLWKVEEIRSLVN